LCRRQKRTRWKVPRIHPRDHVCSLSHDDHPPQLCTFLIPFSPYKLWFQYVALGRSKSVFPFAHVAESRRLSRHTKPTEIGVALTTFGALFMLLGVMLFFDGALLALGNVRLSSSSPLSIHLIYGVFCFPPLDFIHFRTHVDHRPSKDILFLRTETENTRDRVLPRRNPPCVP